MAAIREKELKSVSSVFAELAPDGKDHVGSKMGLTALLRMMWPDDYVDERDGRFINDRVHGNIQRDGTFSVVPRMSGGVTSSDQLRRIADVADKHEIPMIKLTGGQRIDLLGVPKEKLQEVWADLDMPSGWAYGKSFRTVKTCVGTDFCRFGLGDSTQARHRHGGALQGHRGTGEDEARRLGLPAQLRRVDGQGRGSGGRREATGGRSTSAARRGRRSARATSSPPSTPTTRP